MATLLREIYLFYTHFIPKSTINFSKALPPRQESFYYMYHQEVSQSPSTPSFDKKVKKIRVWAEAQPLAMGDTEGRHSVI